MHPLIHQMNKYENSLFIQGIPLHIKRETLLNVFKKSSGFIQMILSDPIRNARKVFFMVG